MIEKKQNKIFHIGRDSQFCKFSLDLFEGIKPNSNEFYVVGGWNKDGFLYHPPEGGIKIYSIKNIFYIYKLLRRLPQSQLIIVHGMSLVGAIAFLVKKNNTKTLWSGWGYDYYGTVKNPDDNLVMEETKKLIKKIKNKKNNIKDIKEKIKYKIWNFLTNSASKKTNYFSAPIPNDFEIFKKRYPNAKAEYKQINYGDTQSTFRSGQVTLVESNILVGNSATATNNHTEIFLKLKNFDLSGRKIIVPLTYGSEEYRNEIIKFGTEIFGNKFFPIVKHTSLNEYLKVVNTCNIVIMNQLRQQAIGNIGACLYQGSYVILNKNNPVYEFFKERKAFIESTDFLDQADLPIGSRIENEIIQNKKILDGFWGNNVTKNNIRKLLKSVLEN